MKTFEELLKEAKTVSDKRTKASRSLKKQFMDVIAPKFAESIDGLGYESIRFTLKNPLISGQEIIEYSQRYELKITNEGDVYVAEDETFTPWGSLKNIYDDIPVNEEHLKFLAVLELCDKIPHKLEELIGVAQAETEKAKELEVYI